MRSFLLCLTRNLPRLLKTTLLLTTLQPQYPLHLSPVFCSSSPPCNHLRSIESSIITLQLDGATIAHAYCFKEGNLVVVSQGFPQDTVKQRRIQYYQGGNKVSGVFRVIGQFENLTFIECPKDSVVRLLPSSNTPHPHEYVQVQVVSKRAYLSISDAYLIRGDQGYGMLSGKGKAGSLVTKDGLVVGIVSQEGKGQREGFARLFEWRALPSLMRVAKGQNVHLGLSAQSVEQGKGIVVVRVSPNSPFNGGVMMGDVIVSANNQQLRTPEGLRRIVLQQCGSVRLQVIRQGISHEVIVRF